MTGLASIDRTLEFSLESEILKFEDSRIRRRFVIRVMRMHIHAAQTFR